MARKLPVKYECEICHRVWSKLSDANTCEKAHNKVATVTDNYFEEPSRFKYPTRIVCEMEDGKRVSYYRSEKMV